MINKKDLELKLLLRESHIQQLNLKIERLNNELENVKAHYETEAEAKYYEFIDNHESKLQQRIDKAIEYIEENLLNEESKDYCYLCKEDNIKIINILKGDDKDEN